MELFPICLREHDSQYRNWHSRIYHLHVRFAGDLDELYFRDFFITPPDVIKEYGQLKSPFERVQAQQGRLYRGKN